MAQSRNTFSVLRCNMSTFTLWDKSRWAQRLESQEVMGQSPSTQTKCLYVELTYLKYPGKGCRSMSDCLAITLCTAFYHAVLLLLCWISTSQILISGTSFLKSEENMHTTFIGKLGSATYEISLKWSLKMISEIAPPSFCSSQWLKIDQ